MIVVKRVMDARTRAAAAAARKAKADAVAKQGDDEGGNVEGEGGGKSVEKRPRRVSKRLAEKDGGGDKVKDVDENGEGGVEGKEEGGKEEKVDVEGEGEGEGEEKKVEEKGVEEKGKENGDVVMDEGGGEGGGSGNGDGGREGQVDSGNVVKEGKFVIDWSSFNRGDLCCSDGSGCVRVVSDSGSDFSCLCVLFDLLVVNGNSQVARDSETAVTDNDAHERAMTLLELTDLAGKLRTALKQVVPKPTYSPPPLPLRHWGNLLSEDPKIKNIPLRTPMVNIGKGSKAVVQMQDSNVPSMAGRFVMVEGKKPTVESHSHAVMISVNGRALEKGQAAILKSGDEVTMSSQQQQYAYVVQLLTKPEYMTHPGKFFPNQTLFPSNMTASTPILSSYCRPKPVKSRQAKREGPSKFAINFAAGLARKKTQGSNPVTDAKKVLADTKLITPPSKGDASKSPKPVANEKDKKDKATLAKVERDLAIAFKGDGAVQKAGGDKEDNGQGKPPLPPSTVDGDAHKGFVENTKTDVESLLKSKNMADAVFAASFIPHEKLDVSFDKFPYSFVSKELQNILDLWARVRLLHPEYTHIASQIPALSAKILLHGPTGTDKYLNALVLALAQRMGASVLSLDLSDEALFVDPSASAKKGSLEKLEIDARDLVEATKELQKSGAEDFAELVRKRVLMRAARKYQSRPKTMAALKPVNRKKTFEEGDRVIFVGSPNWYAAQMMKGATRKPRKDSSAKDSTFPSFSPTRRSRKSSARDLMDIGSIGRDYTVTFDKNDLFSPTISWTASVEDGMNNALKVITGFGLEEGKKTGAFGGRKADYHGPLLAARGKVVLAFSNDAKRVGVRFDKPVSGGNGLGDRCETNHGFFVKTKELAYEGEELQYIKDTPNVFVPLMKKVETEAEKGTPIIILLKDVEKNVNRLCERSPESYKHLVQAIEKTPNRVIVLGTSACAESRGSSFGTPVSGLMSLSEINSSARRLGSSPFSPLGALGSVFYPANPSNPAVDISLFDMGRSDFEKGHSVRAISRAATRMFDIRIPLPYLPQADQKATKLRKEVERDIELGREAKNQERFRKVMNKLNVDPELEGVKELQNDVYADTEIIKITGYAMAHELRERDEGKGKKPDKKSDGETKDVKKTGSDSSAIKKKGQDSESGGKPEEKTDDKEASEKETSRKEVSGKEDIVEVEAIGEPNLLDLSSEIKPATSIEDVVVYTTKKTSDDLNGGGDMEVDLEEDSKVHTCLGNPLVGKKRALEELTSSTSPIGEDAKKQKKEAQDAPRLTLSAASISKGIKMVTSQRAGKDKDAEGKGKTPLSKITCSNDFERKLLSEVVPAEEIGVHFEDIGALDACKESLQEIVMLPLKRPELFRRGNLTKPTKGVLLFGPPGTGKTMLAKAVATEAGANFINITMSSIASKWFGEGEKYVKALFSLARKIAPSVIFIDEVDSMLGKRERPGEHEAMRKIKNEFMSNWDGLRTKDSERVLVLGATNRPFDLDDAVLRRMPRRLLVDLPDAKNRTKILSVITAGEEMDDSVDLKALAESLDGYSGSDLRNLCVAAAHVPIREVLELERKKKKQEAGKDDAEKEDPDEDLKEPDLRQLQQSDFMNAKNEVSASVSEDAFSISELRKWNETYGEGGNRRKVPLPYFT